MAVLHQLTAGFRLGDAISNECVAIRDLCAAHGRASEIWCPPETAWEFDRHLTRDLAGLAGAVRPDDVALLHLSIGSPCNEVFRALPCRRAILYHNVTPAFYFERLDPDKARVLEEGRRQVAALRDAADDVWAVSAFNASELRALGFREPKVFPLVFDPSSLGAGELHGGLFRTLSDPPLANVLFVGRLVPNKRHDRLIQIFAAFQKYVRPDSRLVIVGGCGGMESYKFFLMATARELGLRNVLFLDFIDDPKLRSCYASASAFVCTSDHEGFCAPLVEAMAWHVPVFANAAGAVPETLDGAGTLFSPSDPPELVAETIGRVLGDPALRAAVVRRQDERLARFLARDPWPDLASLFG